MWGKKPRFGSIEYPSILPNVGKKVRFGSIETHSILPNVCKKVRFGKIETKKLYLCHLKLKKLINNNNIEQ